MQARPYFWGAFALCVLLAAYALTGCGGSDHDAPPPADHWLLVMQTTDHQLVPVDVYDTPDDCTAAGSYRLFAFADKYVGYACKEV